METPNATTHQQSSCDLEQPNQQIATTNSTNMSSDNNDADDKAVDGDNDRNVVVDVAAKQNAILATSMVMSALQSTVNNAAASSNVEISDEADSITSTRSAGAIVCRICHNSENPERLVSPCNCRGSLSYVHIYCLERWISTSRCTTCELCHFQYNTVQTLRYSCFQSLRIYYTRNLTRRALQEDCQMFSMLTLVAFGIIGTLLVGLQYYFLQGSWGLSKIWTKGWLLFFLFTTMTVYVINVYMIVKSQLTPWYRWWQSARDIKLIIENRRPVLLTPHPPRQFAREPSTLSLCTQAPEREREQQSQLESSSDEQSNSADLNSPQPTNTRKPRTPTPKVMFIV